VVVSKGEFMQVSKTKEAIYSLKGIMEGLSADHVINKEEVESLQSWIDAHTELHDNVFVSELKATIADALADGILDQHEREEILEFCEHFPRLTGSLNIMKEEMLILHGFMQGVAADEEVNDHELTALKDWMEHHRSNIEKWPYNALNNMLTDAILTKKIEDKRKQEILEFCQSFVHQASGQEIEYDPDLPDFLQHTKNLKTINNIYDDVFIEFPGKSFCLSGNFKNFKKSELRKKITDKGGIDNSSVNKKTNYLVVGSLSSPAWKYGHYGTKVEKAIEMRNEGQQIYILSEERILEVL